MYTFIQYPRCSTCVKARKQLEDQGVSFEQRHIIDEQLNEQELTRIIQKSGLEIKKFFNTSGLVYKEMKLKDQLLSMKDEDKIKLLASNGKLVKRPILETDDRILVGYKEEDYKKVV